MPGTQGLDRGETWYANIQAMLFLAPRPLSAPSFPHS